jgi:hypothetical protein
MMEPVNSPPTEKPLEQPQQHQQDRGGRARLGVGRQQGDQPGRDCHQGDGDDQGLFPTQPVTQVAEGNRPQRAQQKACGENAERGHQRIKGILGGEKQGGEDRGQVAV